MSGTIQGTEPTENCGSYVNINSLQSAIAKEGVTYAVRYIGCLEVKTSMKSLDFETRSQVAKECISRVCEAAGLKTAGSRNVRSRVSRLLGDRPRMEHAGTDVSLTVSSGCLVLSALHTGNVIVRHDMPRISFASGGDTDTLDFVAYVAKNLQEWRACYVLECGGGLAQDVITTIGQAFELRFKQFLTKPANISLALSGWRTADRDYYNDLPGKVPPEVGPPPVPPLPNVTPQHNLIDLNVEPAPINITEHNYVNDSAIISQNTQSRDVFDMQPFTLSAEVQRSQLQREEWFHGSISRSEAEMLLKKDGDFLVRESQGSTGQYVLTGMQGNTKKHLLLIDPEGVVRTKDRRFENVSHLINYHCENELPIISTESALVLRTPVRRSWTPPFS